MLFNKSGCTITKAKNEAIAHTKCENGVYKLQTRSESCMLTQNSFTWHRRLGHIDGIIFKDNGADVKNCEICCAGKMSRLPFMKCESRATSILEIIHSDLDGPMETQSIGHAKYFLTFVDDFSKKIFIYFLKQKSEVLDKLCTHKL